MADLSFAKLGAAQSRVGQLERENADLAAKLAAAQAALREAPTGWSPAASVELPWRDKHAQAISEAKGGA